MKILLATYWSIPHVGGVWQYMTQLKKKLESYGHEVDLLGYDQSNLNVTVFNKGLVLSREKVTPLIDAHFTQENYPAMYANFLVKWTEMQRYVYELSASYFGVKDYDIIHTQDVLSTVAMSRIKDPNTPLIATLHGSVAHEIRHQLETVHKSETDYLARTYYDELEHDGAVSADTTIVCNQWLQTMLTNEFHVPKEQLKVLHYGFDTETFIQKLHQKATLEAPKGKKVIIYTGRLVELKGVNYLIDAFAKLKQIRNDWVGWIVGTGEKESELKSQALSLGLGDSVRFLGKREDVPSLLSQADILVLPTLIENQPLSVIEAQIAGKAVIASNVGGILEMIQHGVTGMLTPQKNADVLFGTINQLLSDDQLRKNLGINARKWGLTHWSIDRGTQDLLNIYLQAISAKGKGEKLV
ncbi:glycosyltransferase family 4 protein [Sporolactobacillus nakayamae]|uniref:Glycosyltransferase involved in cell wall bisynthesis n=1 Tax=Sporolactobacillus nakayamae TaxID=269670 RepID=A0A1I2QJD8_9BACL|nr:glycosyltransferase family 4 protein [Sporolactobacillus nakayamae]SFG28070.1 Glycosyltransferase involved in cell wall bisynthesis [Sporolactobacillus nakayamae]